MLIFNGQTDPILVAQKKMIKWESNWHDDDDDEEEKKD